MHGTSDMRIDTLIFGGGGAGLWLLDELHRAGHSVLLLESGRLGEGQTISSQGIIHGGLKYTLSGLLNESAKAISGMPELWRECLSGRGEPDLSETPVLTDHCHMWRTSSLSSKLAMVGARKGLHATAEKVSAPDRPRALESCPGQVYRVNEQVIDPFGFIRNLSARHGERIMRVDDPNGVTFQTTGAGWVKCVALTHPETERIVELQPRFVVLTAGAGNASLRDRVGLAGTAMQRRPLHMVMVRGDLPALFGHCVDGAKTRVTITTAEDSRRHMVWLVGGQLAEDGVEMAERDLIQRAAAELRNVLPGGDFAGAEWATYRVDRAEAKTAAGLRPSGVSVRREGNVITAWPTKLALVPELAKLTMELVGSPSVGGSIDTQLVANWPRPDIAPPPWETDRTWIAAT